MEHFPGMKNDEQHRSAGPWHENAQIYDHIPRKCETALPFCVHPELPGS